MDGWTYLEIKIKSKEFVSALKGTKLWSRVGADVDVEVTDDTFTYYNDQNAPPCEAPKSINDLSGALLHFFVERYDYDFTSAKRICGDPFIKTIQEVDWVYSGPEDEDEAPEFHWTKSAVDEAEFEPYIFAKVIIGTKSRKSIEFTIKDLDLKDFTANCFTVSKSGTLYYDKIRVNTMPLLYATLVHCLYTKSRFSVQYKFASVLTYLTLDNAEPDITPIVKALKADEAYKDVTPQELKVAAENELKAIGENTTLTVDIIPKVKEALENIATIEKVKRLKIISGVQLKADDKPTTSTYFDASLGK